DSRPAGRQRAPRQRGLVLDEPRIVGTHRQTLDRLVEEFGAAAVLATTAEDAASQRQQIDGNELDAKLRVELVGAPERAQSTVQVAALRQDLSQGLLARGLLSAVR